MRYCLPLLLALLFVGCEKRKAEKQAEEDEEIIQEYIASNGLNAVATGSGLYYVIDDPGTGASCNENSTVKVAYSGYFTSGAVFDESTSGLEISLQNVIEGWREGIPYFKEGGSGKLLIPSALAYGTQGTVGIPENSVVIFDVELLEVL